MNPLAVPQVILKNCLHFEDCDEAIHVPDAEEGIVVVDMPKHVDCEGLWVTVFDDGLSVRVVVKLPVRYARMGDVVFGMSDDDLTSILLTGLSPEEVSHARAGLSGDGYDDVWVPEGD